MKKLLAAILSMTMILSMSVTAFATNPTPDSNSGFSRTTVENLFANQPSTLTSQNTMTPEEEKELFLEVYPQIQSLRIQQQMAEERGEDTVGIEQQISDLEIILDGLSSFVKLNNEQMQTLGMKPSVPSGSRYVECWSHTTTGRYNGTTYDVFEIYAGGTRYGGFANNLGYQEEGIVLFSDANQTASSFASEVYGLWKFALGCFSVKFAAADYFVLSKFPDFFEASSTQQLLLGYNALQTYCFSYVAERNSDWYDHTLTTDSVNFCETLTAVSVAGAGDAVRTSKDREDTIETTHYADSNEAAKNFANYSHRGIEYVQYIKYKVNGSVAETVNFNCFSELYSIPGL